MVEARYAVLALFAPGGDVLHHHVSGLADDEAERVVMDRDTAPVLAAVLREGRAVRRRDASSEPVAIGLPAGHPALREFLGVPVAATGPVRGWLYFGDRLDGGAFGDDDARLATMLGAQLAIVYASLDRVRLLERQAATLEEEIGARQRVEGQLRVAGERLKILSHQLLQAQETERRRIARELHDEIGQWLTALKLNLGSALQGSAEAATRELVRDSLRITERTMAVTRDLSMTLRPAVLDDLGLVPALRWCLDQHARRAGFETGFHADLGRGDVSADLAITCFRIAQEALTNIARHAATKRVSTAVSVRDGELRLVIADDGAGFDVGAALARATRGESLGLLAMQERAALLGGDLVIESAKGRGTTLRARLPLA